LFFEKGQYADLSQSALHYIGGILKHAPALLAFCAPTTNSYRRLVPGYEAPINLIYSQRNRSAAVRIPLYSRARSPSASRCASPIRRRTGTSLSAPCSWRNWTAFQNKMTPPGPLDKDLYDLSPEDLAKVAKTPGGLEEALESPREDHQFLLEGDVFTSDVIEMWLSYKLLKEIDAIRLRPHRWEFALYFDI
jgi:glutamine synthetase